MPMESSQAYANGFAVANFDARRQYPRVNFVTAVQLRTNDQVAYGFSENISLGGMLIRCESAFVPNTKLTITFILREAGRVQLDARVVHCRPGVRLGLQFVELTSDQRELLRSFTQPNITVQRRSPRVPVRLFVRLHWFDQGKPANATAETVLISRHGCMMLTQAEVESGASVSLTWPEVGTAAQARVVSRQDCPGEMSRVALEFKNVDDFWGSYFPTTAVV